MKDFGFVLLSCRTFLQTPLSFDGFTFTMWDVLLWSLVAGAVIWMIVTWLR